MHLSWCYNLHEFLGHKNKKVSCYWDFISSNFQLLIICYRLLFFFIGFHKNAWLTFPDRVNPVNMKFMSSPLLHLSELPSIFNSTLLGSNKKKFNITTWNGRQRVKTLYKSTSWNFKFLPKLHPAGGSIFKTNVPLKKRKKLRDGQCKLCFQDSWNCILFS